MSDGAISQDEIDALLSGVDMGASGGSPSIEETLKPFISGLQSTIADNLSTITGVSASIDQTELKLCSREACMETLPEGELVSVLSDFSDGVQGEHLFVLAPEFAQKLAVLISKDEEASLDEMGLSVVAEVISQHAGAELTALAKLPGLSAAACNPAEASLADSTSLRLPDTEFVLITYTVSLDEGEYTLWEAIARPPAEKICEALNGGPKQESKPAGANSGGGMPQNTGFSNANMGMSTPNVQQLQYPNLQGGPAVTEQSGNIGLIMDVYMEMTVELGRTKKQIKEILGMGEGTIIELDKLAGEPVDILVNHKPIAKGEVVVIDENFGVRVTEILSPSERVSDLR